MIVAESIRQALRTLVNQKVRAFLTLFGFIWGTAAVILLVSWGDGVRHTLERGVAKIGRNIGIIHAGKLTADFKPASDRRYLWFDNDDLEAVKRRARLPDGVAGELQHFAFIDYGQNAATIDMRGIEPEIHDLRGVGVAAGRRIARTDLDHRRRVVVLGHELRRNLLGARGGVGEKVRINGVPFEVVGILEKVGIQLSQDGLLIDEQAWIPLNTMQARWPESFTDEPVVRTILFRVTDRHLYEAARDEVQIILADRLNVPRSDSGALETWSPMEMLNTLPLDKLPGLLFLFGLTTVVIGGIGIVNMMLEAVHERRQEIGVRLALGARPREVLLQFFLESLAISSVGGSLGIAIGVGGCLALAAPELPDIVPIPILSWTIVVVAFVVMGVVGFAAGVLPAWRATQIDPSITLRLE